MKTDEMIIGTSAYPNADTDLMKDAGIGWVRQGFNYPFVDEVGGETTDAYQEAKANAQAWVEKGFRVMGVTPLLGIGKREPDDAGRLQMVWHDRVPAYMDAPGSEAFLRHYRELCRFLAQDLHGLVDMWQIANELDITIFAGPLNPREASDLILSGARGLKMGDPGLIVGTNTAGSEKAYFLYGRLHAEQEGLIDYCGVDAYYGTWQAGGPGLWSDRIAELYALTETPVLINEWGYSSTGGLLTEEERETQPYVCQYKKWYHAWDEGHTPEVQGKFVEQAFEGFHEQRDKLLGLFFYRWEDQETCWQCGAPDCPAETAWGLVGVDQAPKPAYHAFKAGVEQLKGE
jgi:hypothetical protein